MGNVAYLIVAAGRGLRAGGGLPKQYRALAGRPVIAHTIRALVQARPDAPILTIVHPGDRLSWDAAMAPLRADGANILEPAAGGATRQQSVLAGLEALSNIKFDKKIVLIHDCVRIFLSKILIENLIRTATVVGAAIPGYPVPDALKKTSPDSNIDGVISRDGLYAVQTPQAFDFELILSAHRLAAGAGLNDFPDDAAVAEWAGHKVQLVPGEKGNFKLTEQEDFELAEQLLLARNGDVRTGQGFDVHTFASGGAGPAGCLYLGDIEIPFERSLAGHSDADVVLHAITDALLGTIGDGDIGTHFPPSDTKWRGARSHIFLEDAVRRIAQRGGIISHIDVTIIAEAPKIGPHREAMRASIAKIAGLAIERISVKATTTEKLGFTGRGEGIATQAIATVRLPWEQSSS